MSLLYLGPGVGGGILALIIGGFIILVLGIMAFFWYPIKRIINIIFKGKK